MRSVVLTFGHELKSVVLGTDTNTVVAMVKCKQKTLDLKEDWFVESSKKIKNSSRTILYT